ncbi:MAG: hypothetical protein OEW11_09665 [Nitrospirota bacterium]|nr:hypothetical protein [Nitrospirota bacterium]
MTLRDLLAILSPGGAAQPGTPPGKLVLVQVLMDVTTGDMHTRKHVGIPHRDAAQWLRSAADTHWMAAELEDCK